ncbi:MAG: hypothetical protein J6M55_04405, partial [Paludibacteraceae bacterium]|nr:hypothetical protein [Paludibacteraceae bacterium]
MNYDACHINGGESERAASINADTRKIGFGISIITKRTIIAITPTVWSISGYRDSVNRLRLRS